VRRVRGRPGTTALDGVGGVRLLFDENLSHRLVALLAEELPGSAQVRDVGLSTVWLHARTQGLAIVSKDSDFQ
jgi:predicted nuclease of predicted toxin-antitoxin system